MYYQKAILAYLAEIRKEDYRLADADEEAKGIDGFVGKTAYSIKPDTYKTMGRLLLSATITLWDVMCSFSIR